MKLIMTKTYKLKKGDKIKSEKKHLNLQATLAYVQQILGVLGSPRHKTPEPRAFYI